MRRWDRLLDSYIEEYRARGVSPQSVEYTEARPNRWGRWLKGCRPRIGIERIDAEMITRYILELLEFPREGDSLRDAEHDAGLR